MKDQQNSTNKVVEPSDAVASSYRPTSLATRARALAIESANFCPPFHFSHLFKQSLGTAPYQYLLQQRVERAKQLLKQTDR
jgi:AraC-like DNA-binding protein